MSQPDDIRDTLFLAIRDARVKIRVSAQRDCVLVGSGDLARTASEIGLPLENLVPDGAPLHAGSVVAEAVGSPKQVAIAEERLIGCIAKPSGIAWAARQAVAAAGPGIQVACGAWKKMPMGMKEIVRPAIVWGGALPRICSEPFVYLDKNYVRMLGGVKEAVTAARSIPGRSIVVQVRGEWSFLGEEAVEGALAGASILMVDTGILSDARAAISALRGAGLRERVKVAFGGGIKIEDIPQYRGTGIDILDIGAEIVDAPLADFRLDVVR